MPTKKDWQAALAICAAIVGAGFASGREIVSFFSGFGGASWLGILAASAGIGGLTYVILRLSGRTQSKTFPELYGALMGQSCQDALHVLHGLMCLCTASAMLSAGAELGALTFPIRRAYALGFLLTLCAGLTAVCTGFRALSLMGALLVPALIAYYISLSAGSRIETPFAADRLLASIPMGLLYASFNAALSGSAICLAARKGASPARTGVLTGLLMLILLACANCAMLSADESTRQMALPAVVMSARWGITGYYVSIAVMWLAILSTLCAMLHSLQAQLTSAKIGRISALILSASGASVLAVCGFQTLVDVFYPLLGWICGFTLAALLLFLPPSRESDE